VHVVACDLRTGAEARLSEGPLVDALLASAALAGVFRPVESSAGVSPWRRTPSAHAPARVPARALQDRFAL
jgi:hypothetical protein